MTDKDKILAEIERISSGLETTKTEFDKGKKAVALGLLAYANSLSEERSDADDARAKEGDFSPSRSLNKVNWEALRKFVNSVFDLHNSNISRLKYPFSRGEKARIQRLVNQHGKAALVDAIVNLSKSDILNGRKCYNRFWKASFYWLIEKDEHFEKVKGGYYDNPPEQQLPPAEARRLAEEAKKMKAAEERVRQREIDEQISAEREAAREYAAAHAVTYEEYQAMKKQGLI